MYCTNCGEEVTGNFCSNCGAKVIRKNENPPKKSDNAAPTSDAVSFAGECISENLIENKTEEIPVYKKTWFWVVVIAYIITLVVVIAIVINNYSGPGGSYGRSGSSYSDTTDTISASEAIQKAKDAPILDQRIASELGFNQFYKPEFGTTEATENSDGSWKVVLKGKMSGYVDDYVSDFETMKFEVEVEILSTGTALIRNVRKVY